MSSREEFEAWYLNRNYRDFQDLGKQCLEKLPDGDYLRSAPSISWAAWQASRAAAVVELPQLSKPTPWESTDNAWNNAIKACAKAIQAAGIPVKQS